MSISDGMISTHVRQIMLHELVWRSKQFAKELMSLCVLSRIKLIDRGLSKSLLKELSVSAPLVGIMLNKSRSKVSVILITSNSKPEVPS